jgi:excinuclease ABC subunit C
MTLNPHIQDILQRLPEQPGVYQYLNKDGEVIYVGKAKNLKRRVSSYFHKEQDRYKTKLLVKSIADIKYVVVQNEQDAFLLENNLIKQYQPHYNILLKDGKSYPSICITREDYPRIFKTRNIIKGVGEYYGPYSFTHTLDLVLELIHKLYPLRTCSQKMSKSYVEMGKYRVCLKYHLGNCCGVCEGKASREKYLEYIDAARKIIRGDAQEIAKQIEAEMLQAAMEMRYEEAGKLKEKLEFIENFKSKTIITNSHAGDVDVFGYDEMGQNVYISMLHVHKGSIIQGQTIEYKKQLDESREEILAIGIYELREQLGSTTKELIVPFIPDIIDENLRINIALQGDKKKLLDLAMQNVQQYKKDRIRQEDKLNPDQKATRILSSLQQLLGLPTLPIWIDSFDNSNTQGTDAVAGCVVFKKARPCKSEYKKFEIKSVTGPDDYGSMREVVRRRYTRLVEENSPLPDLIIADGGLGQMSAIKEVVNGELGLQIPVAGLKKDNRHRTNTLLYGDPTQEFGMKVTDEIFRLMVEIQDEVHRYAITFHKKRRSKSQTKSELDDIQGVGPATKQKILQRFGSVARARSASLEEWIDLLGTRSGTRVYEYFRNKITP